MIVRVQDSSMTNLPSGNQKRFWRDPVKRAGSILAERYAQSVMQ